APRREGREGPGGGARAGPPGLARPPRGAGLVRETSEPHPTAAGELPQQVEVPNPIALVGRERNSMRQVENAVHGHASDSRRAASGRGERLLHLGEEHRQELLDRVVRRTRLGRRGPYVATYVAPLH